MAVQATHHSPWIRVVAIGSIVAIGIVASGCAAISSSTPGPTNAPAATSTATPASSPGNSTNASTPASAAPGPTATGWTAVPAGTFAGATFQDVESYAKGFVAVGSAPIVDGRQFGGIWTSADGVTWSSPPPDGFGDSMVRAAAATGEGILAVGMTCTGECGGFYAWRSTATGEWPAEATASDAFDTVPTAVVVRGPLMVATGFQTLDESGGSRGVVFTSRDGKTWHAAGSDATWHGARPIAIAAAKGFVIVGSVTTPGGRAAAAWTSPDGKAWTRATDDPSFATATILSVIAGGPGYVAVGSVGTDGAVWTSTDGATWARLADGGTFSGSPLADVAAGPDGLIAIGDDTTGGTAWTSTDGSSWVKLPAIPGSAGSTFQSVTAGPTSSVIVAQPPRSAPAAGLVFVGPTPSAH